MLDFTLWTSDSIALCLMRARITASLVQLDKGANRYPVYLEWVSCPPEMGILATWNGYLGYLEWVSCLPEMGILST